MGSISSFLPDPPFVLHRFPLDPLQGRASEKKGRLLFDPIEVLEGKTADLRSALDRIEQGGDWFGFLGYEIGEITEGVSPRPPSSWSIPDFWFARFGSEREIDWHAVARRETGPPESTFLEASLSSRGYRDRLRSIQKYLLAGDIYQANLSVRFTVETTADPFALFFRCCEESLAGHPCFLDTGPWKILSISPELFLYRHDRRMVTRPIKGTVGKSGRKPADRRALRWLRESPKNLAELLMIVDLERNDLGRLCEFGSVRVDRFPEVLEFPHLYHLAATVHGRLRSNVSLSEILFSTFPGGSISGAPKRRALEIIRELEPHRRGPYCGAIGHVSTDKIHLNLAIRTAVWRKPRLRFHGGGGIVVDHDPESERKEILAKVLPFLKALNLSPPEFWQE